MYVVMQHSTISDSTVKTVRFMSIFLAVDIRYTRVSTDNPDPVVNPSVSHYQFQTHTTNNTQ